MPSARQGAPARCVSSRGLPAPSGPAVHNHQWQAVRTRPCRSRCSALHAAQHLHVQTIGACRIDPGKVDRSRARPQARRDRDHGPSAGRCSPRPRIWNRLIGSIRNRSSPMASSLAAGRPRAGRKVGGHARLVAFGEIRRPAANRCDHRSGVPRGAIGMGVQVIENAALRQVDRGPLPEELRHGLARLRVCRTDRADTPAPVACAHAAFAKPSRARRQPRSSPDNARSGSSGCNPSPYAGQRAR